MYVTGRSSLPLHDQRGDGAAEPVSELQDPAGLCRPLHRRGRLQAHRLPQAGGSLFRVISSRHVLWQTEWVKKNPKKTG